MLRMRAEASIQQLVRREHLALEIGRDEQPADDEPRHDVAEDDLEISQTAALLGPRICRIRERRHANQRQRARFGGDDGEADDAPGGLTIAEKIVLDRRMRSAEAAAKGSDPDKVEREDCVIES